MDLQVTDDMGSDLEELAAQSSRTASPSELADRLRGAMLASNVRCSNAALGAVELAVAVLGAVPNPEANVFWDCADHARPFAMLIGDSVPTSHTDRSPGRALSDAVGTAAARTLRGVQDPVVCVIDGMSLSRGLAFEAVNHAGHLRLPLVAVLIDSHSTRGRGVGAMGRYLARIRGHARYADAKIQIEQALARIPAGEQAVEVARRLKNSIRELLIPTEVWEELLGFAYLGPVDGHNPNAMRDIISLAMDMRRPVAVHITTESSSVLGRRTHEPGVSQVHPEHKWLIESEEVIRHTMRSNQRRVIVTTETDSVPRMSRLSEEFPERYFDVPQGEAHAVAFAASIAAQGFLPTVVVPASRLTAALATVASESTSKPVPVTLLVHPDDAAVSDPTDLRMACVVEGLAVVVPFSTGTLRELVGHAEATGGWTLVRLPTLPPGIDIEPNSVTVDGVRVWTRPGSSQVVAATGPATAAARMAASRINCTALGITRIASIPSVDARLLCDHCFLVVDAEFGPALKRFWPPELVDRTTVVQLAEGLDLEAQAGVIVNAARQSSQLNSELL